MTPQSAASAPWLRRHFPKLLLALLATAVLAGGAYLSNRQTPEDQLANAKTLQRQGDFKGAIIEIKSALQAMPANPEVRFQLAQAQFAGNEFANAEKELLKARELGLQRDELTLLLARTWIALKKFDLVVDGVQTRDGAASEVNASLLALLAKAQLARGEHAAAQQSLDNADKFSPDQPDTLLVRAQLALERDNAANALVLVEKGLAKSPSHPDLLATQGDLLLKLARTGLAQAAFEKALALAPGNIPARLELIQMHLQATAADKADAELKKLDIYSPGNLTGLLFRAQMDFSRKRYDDALGKIQGVIRAAPDYLPARLLAGEITLALGKREEAQSHFQRVLGADPNHPVARRLMAVTMLEMGQLDRAKELVTALTREGDDAQLTLLRGGIALQGKDFAEANRQFQKVADTHATSPKLFIGLATSQEGSGNIEGAIHSLGKAAELDKTSMQADLLLVTLLINHRRFDDAFKTVDKLAAKKPNPAVLDNVRGVIFVAKRDKAQARASFTKALKTDPKFMPAVSNLANLDIEAKDFKAAAGRYEEVLKLSPNDSHTFLALANLSALQRDNEGYRGYLEKAKRTDGKSVPARQQLARYWLGKNNPGQALAEAREALAATGDNSFYELIGLAQAQQGDTQGALATFERWALDNPGVAIASMRLAQAQAQAGNHDAALKTLDRVLAASPGAIDAQGLRMSLLIQLGQRAEALKLARELQGRQPKAAIGYLGEADVLVAEKKPLDAARLFGKAAEMTGNSEYIVRAYQAYLTGGQDAIGIQTLQHWLQGRPGETMARHQLAIALGKAHREKESVEQYRALLRANPADVTAANNLAWLLSELKDPGALAAAEQAYKLSPDNPATQDTLGYSLIQNGQGKRGVALIKQAIDKKPDSLEFQWHYAKALIAVGEPVLARHELDRLLTSGKNFPRAEEARKLMDSLKR